ncbi:MAG: hypothetical protein JSV39_02280 [Candidatus Aenigmatarchaeota archaeon]|nr:MAG: hypothetical protein JSV39_02280 [Candidatus Aenigmarchaeota archaeon]
MKLVLFLGTLIIFISCFFIFFTFDSMLRSELICSFKEKFVCNVTELNMTIVFGILIVGFFIFVDSLVIYVMVKSWAPDLFSYS